MQYLCWAPLESAKEYQHYYIPPNYLVLITVWTEQASQSYNTSQLFMHDCTPQYQHSVPNHHCLVTDKQQLTKNYNDNLMKRIYMW